MQTCKSKAKKMLIKGAAFMVAGIFAYGLSSSFNTAYAQSTSGYDSFSSIGSISSPDMPTISSPTMGNGFYMPGNNSNPIYTGSSTTSTTKTESNSTNSEITKSDTATALISTLTASDISTLDSLGLLNSVTSLYSSDLTSASGLTGLTGVSSLSNLYTSSSTSQTNVLLQKVLTELQSIKEQNAKESTNGTLMITSESGSAVPNTASNSISNAAGITIPATAQSPNTKEAKDSGTKRNNPKILRFSVNGYDILSTCRTIYISQIQANGSFLVTGDRRYLSDGKTRTETFHILFKPNEASNGISSYTTAAGVTQDYENIYSFLYQLAQMDNLIAQRTGNLVSLRTTDSSWKLELLLDLGE